MKKKVLLLGAVSCVAGIVTATAAGCSSSDTTTTTTQPDATSEGGTKPDRVIPEAGEEDAGNCPINEPLAAADLEAKPGYKPGKQTPDACSSADLTQFEKNLDDTNITTWKGLEKDLTADCAKCIITSTAADNWGPVVYTAESNGDRGFYNFGACFGIVEKASCGKAVQFLEFCLDTACDCATTSAERKNCLSKAGAAGGMCEDFVKTLDTECKDLDNSGNKCNNIGDAAKVVCGPAITDGGSDADANDQ